METNYGERNQKMGGGGGGGGSRSHDLIMKHVMLFQ